MIAPVIQIKKLLDALLEWVVNDYNNTSETQTWLYRIFYGNTIDNFDFYEQAINLIQRDENSKRKLETRISYDKSRAELPTVFILPPLETKDGANALAMNLGSDYYINEDNSGTLKYSRHFGSVYDLMITSSNKYETLLIYELLITLFISSADSLSSLFVNFDYSGKELITNNQIIPHNVFLRVISLKVQFYREVPAVAISNLPISLAISYSNFNVEYTSQGIVTCYITATNHTGITQNCIVYFKLDDYYVRVEGEVLSYSSVVLEGNFENIDNTQEHEVEVYNSALQLLYSNTLSITEFFTYSNFSAVYADDADYNDVISCSLTATNNSAIAQNCIINFKTGKYIVQVQQTIAANSSVVLECTFENIDIFQENIVTVIDLQNNTIGIVTIPAASMPVFEMSYTSGTLAFRVGRYVESFITYLELEDGSTREVNINNCGGTAYISISQVYALGTSKRISILDPFYVDCLDANAQTNLTIDYNQLEKLRNLTYLVLYNLPNCYVSEHEIEKLTNLTYLDLQFIPNCYITEHEIEKLTNLTYLYLQSISNCYIAEHEIEKLTKLINLYLYNLPNCYIAEHEFEKLTKLIYLYLYNLPNCYIPEHGIEKLTNLTYLYLALLSNCYIAEHEIEKLTNLTYLRLYTLSNCYIAEHEIEKLTNLTYLYLALLSNCYIAEHEIEKLTNLTYLYLTSLSNCYIAEHEIEKLTKIPKTNQIFILAIKRLKVANNEQFSTHYLYLNNNNMTSTDCDNVFISCHAQLLAGFVPGTKNINTAGTTNGKVTAASLTARNYLVAQGYTLTYNS